MIHRSASEGHGASATLGPGAATPQYRIDDVSDLVHPSAEDHQRRSRRLSLSVRVLVPTVIVAAWWLLSGLGVVASYVLPTPAAVASTFWNLLLHGGLLADIGVSVLRALSGVAIGAGLGLILGIIVGLSDLGEELIDSTMQMIRTVPFPAVLFLFIVWFGIGETAKVLLIALATLYPMYLNVAQGVRNVDRKVIEAAHSFGLRGRALITQVVLPLAMPSILTGLRFATGISIIALVFAETINANQGIGYLTNQASSLDEVSVLIVTIFAYAALGILGDLSIRMLERKLMPWRRNVAIR